MTKKNFFISYSHHDYGWAKWIHWHLVEAGYTVLFQPTDIRPGEIFLRRMEEAVEEAERVLAVLSPDYLTSAYAQLERYATIVKDPSASSLVPILVRPCKPPAMLKMTVWINLIGLTETEAKDALLTGVGPILPTKAPVFPPESEQQPTFPIEILPGRRVPRPSPPLIGRQTAVAKIKTLLKDPETQLITLSGCGGIGKTQLALQTATEFAVEERCDAFFTDLTLIKDHTMVLSEIARSVGLREIKRLLLLNDLQDYLQDKTILLIIDNFEHVISAATDIDRLADGCPNVKFIITSQRILSIGRERVFDVEPLKVPGDIDRRPLEKELERIREIPSVKLFLTRSNTELTPANAHTVTAICRKLSGLPLAIELIAAFAKINPPTATLKFLETSGFLALKNTRRDAQKRHQTISQAIESSYRQLSEQEKQLFRQLAVFTGSFSKKAAQEVCASADGSEFDVTAGLTALLELSLLKQTFLNGEPRFTMLEPIRAFSLNELESHGEMSVLRAAHARYFVKLAEEAEPKLTSRERTPGKWLERLQANHDNFRAVLEWNRETRLLHYESLRLAGSLFWFWNLRAYLSEGRAWLETVLKQKESDQYPEAKAKALYGAGGLAFLSGDFKAASWHLRKSIKLWEQLGAKRQLGYALIIAGMVAIDRIHYRQARALLQRSVDIFNSEVEDKWGRALALNDLGRVFMARAKFKEGEHYFERSLAIWRELEDDWGQPLTLICLGELAYRQRNFDKARESLEEALRIQQRDDKWGRAGLLKFLGNIYLETGNFKEAAVRYHESLLMHRDLGRKQLIAECLEGLARLAREMAKPDQAVYLFSAARRLHREIRGYPQKDDFNIFQQYQDQLKSHIGEAAFRVANNKGETDTLEKLLKVAIDFAESVGT